MGSAMGRRLLASAQSLCVWNRTASRAQPLVDAGARWTATPAALCEASDCILTMVTDETALDALFDGPDGLLAHLRPGTLVIDMSTVSPDKPRALGARVRSAGARFLECPVGGSVGPAAEGKLLGFVGGQAEDLQAARPVLELLCRRIEHVGDLGAGATMKLAINLPLLVYWQTLSEALSLLEPLGLDPARVVDILADTSGGPNMLKSRGPVIARALSGQGDGAVSVDLATLAKDLRAMLAQAGRTGFRLPVTALALQSYEAAAAQGLAGADCTQLPVWWLASAGRTEVR